MSDKKGQVKKIFLLTCWFVIYSYICTPKTTLTTVIGKPIKITI